MTNPVQLSGADERDVHSQSGEDGIITRIFSALRIERGNAVKFGAWDGAHLSNTALLREHGWTTVLIEADPAEPKRLERLAGALTGQPQSELRGTARTAHQLGSQDLA